MDINKKGTYTRVLNYNTQQIMTSVCIYKTWFLRISLSLSPSL